MQMTHVDSSTEDVGDRMYQFACQMFPWHRSIMGAGVRRTLEAIGQHIPLQIRSVPSGTDVLGWKIPDEWVIRNAFVHDELGQTVIDYQRSNLHVVNYSTPVDRRMTWDELKPHLHTLPDRPDWIPYRTSYFQQTWGFCLSHHDFERIAASGQREYHVRIDAEFKPGTLEYGELVLPGRRQDEMLFTTHICHPSLANDNLSSIVVLTELAKQLAAETEREFTQRFLFAPATIGAITWLAINRHNAHRIRAGLVLANLGDSGSFHYKQSRQGDALIDRIASKVIDRQPVKTQTREFTPFGYDERQYCSPGFNLPMGRLTRTPNDEYPQYHTSADDLSLISPSALAESLSMCFDIATEFTQAAMNVSNWRTSSCASSEIARDLKDLSKNAASQRPFELDQRFLNTHPECEPPLGVYGLYRGYGQSNNFVDQQLFQQAVLWVLNYSDGLHSLADIQQISHLDIDVVQRSTERLLECGLLRPCEDSGRSVTDE